MSDDNDKTLQAYEAHIQEYVAGTPRTIEGEFRDWLDRALALIPKHGTVLELGSAFGRDAAYIKSKGFKITATDAVQGFVDLLRESGHEAKLLNALTDDFGQDYDMLFANAVFLHFTPEQTKQILLKARAALKPGGIIAFSLKKGNGSEWTDAKLGSPRYFHYWNQPDLQALVAETGFKIVEIRERRGSASDWLQVIARK